MIFLETSESITLEDLKKIENDFKIKFSGDFKDHYLKYNGGYPEKDRFQWKDNGSTTINNFFLIKYEGFGNMESTYKNLVIDEKYLPEKILPFAVDDGGNFFCISLRDNDYDHIYYGNDDHYDVNDNEAHLTLLTNSFKKFINGLV